MGQLCDLFSLDGLATDRAGGDLLTSFLTGCFLGHFGLLGMGQLCDLLSLDGLATDRAGGDLLTSFLTGRFLGHFGLLGVVSTNNAHLNRATLDCNIGVVRSSIFCFYDFNLALSEGCIIQNLHLQCAEITGNSNRSAHGEHCICQLIICCAHRANSAAGDVHSSTANVLKDILIVTKTY